MLKKLIQYYNKRKDEKLKERILEHVSYAMSSDPNASQYLRYEVDHQFKYIKGLIDSETN